MICSVLDIKQVIPFEYAIFAASKSQFSYTRMLCFCFLVYFFVFVYSFRVFMCEHSTDNQSTSIYCIYIICCWFVMGLLVLQDCVYFQSLPHFLYNEIDYLCNGIIVGGIIVSSSLLFLFFCALISLSICWTNKNEIELKNGNWIG